MVTLPQVKRARQSPPPRRPALPDFLPFQNPKLVDKPPSGSGWRHEIKFDGYRMQLRVEGGAGRWFSRNGFDWTTRLEDFEEAIGPAGRRLRR